MNQTLIYAGLLLAGVFLAATVPCAAAQSRRATVPSSLEPIFCNDADEGSERGNSMDTATKVEADITQFVGDWTSGGTAFTIEGGKWKWGAHRMGAFKVVGHRGDVVLVDMYLDENQGGQFLRAIFRRERDTLHYCGTYGPTRPTDFKQGNGIYYIAWKPVGK